MTKTEFFTTFILARAGVLGKNQFDTFDAMYDAEQVWKKLSILEESIPETKRSPSESINQPLSTTVKVQEDDIPF